MNGYNIEACFDSDKKKSDGYCYDTVIDFITCFSVCFCYYCFPIYTVERIERRGRVGRRGRGDEPGEEAVTAAAPAPPMEGDGENGHIWKSADIKICEC